MVRKTRIFAFRDVRSIPLYLQRHNRKLQPDRNSTVGQLNILNYKRRYKTGTRTSISAWKALTPKIVPTLEIQLSLRAQIRLKQRYDKTA